MLLECADKGFHNTVDDRLNRRIESHNASSAFNDIRHWKCWLTFQLRCVATLNVLIIATKIKTKRFAGCKHNSWLDIISLERRFNHPAK